jgi:hypothetical protein
MLATWIGVVLFVDCVRVRRLSCIDLNFEYRDLRLKSYGNLLAIAAPGPLKTRILAMRNKKMGVCSIIAGERRHADGLGANAYTPGMLHCSDSW